MLRSVVLSAPSKAGSSTAGGSVNPDTFLRQLTVGLVQFFANTILFAQGKDQNKKLLGLPVHHVDGAQGPRLNAGTLENETYGYVRHKIGSPDFET
eukprot:GSA25T00026053001.1